MKKVGLMRVFIGVPMEGRTTEEIEHDIIAAKDSFPFTKSTFVSPIIDDNTPDDDVACLAESIKLLSICDAAFFAPGWENSKACKLERAICEAYKIHIYN